MSSGCSDNSSSPPRNVRRERTIDITFSRLWKLVSVCVSTVFLFLKDVTPDIFGLEYSRPSKRATVSEFNITDEVVKFVCSNSEEETVVFEVKNTWRVSFRNNNLHRICNWAKVESAQHVRELPILLTEEGVVLHIPPQPSSRTRFVVSGGLEFTSPIGPILDFIRQFKFRVNRKLLNTPFATVRAENYYDTGYSMDFNLTVFMFVVALPLFTVLVMIKAFPLLIIGLVLIIGAIGAISFGELNVSEPVFES